ncbi:hypothetical protein AALT52_01475 [Ligilactobacillus faecis]|uniref:Uncharacterized protein n=1 Tax=Ligilactobacillus faecis TaxID=762833 RepID=A0ABV4DM68_9LACO
MEKIWMLGYDMQEFIKENDCEAMYFTPNMVEVHPEQNISYLVGLDEQGKNSIVFDTQK